MNPIIAKYLLYYPVTLINGENIAKHLKSYEQFQWLPNEKIIQSQTTSLTNIIEHVKNNSPYYSSFFGEDLSLENFNSAPFLTKQLLIKNFDQICTSRIKGASLKTTGGSTGEPVRIYKNSDALARERAATWRSYGWAGIGIGDKQARFWGVPHNKKNAFKAKLIDIVSNRKRISAFNLTEHAMNQYYKSLIKFKPKYLYGYVSVIKKFCEFIESQSLPAIPSITSIITTSEVLSDHDRAYIEKIFKVKIYNEYGCGEVGSIAHECEHGKMHIVSDNLLVEIVDSHGNACETGEVVVTDFFNHATPLIRYRLGDFATISYESCSCGRTLPVLKGIHGRAYDIIKTTSGKSIHPEALIYIFEELQQQHGAFNQFQIIQRRIDKLEAFIIPTQKWNSDIKEKITTSIHSKIDSSMKIEFIECGEIKREQSGKMRVVKSEI